jgi:hypothetical protein
MTPCAHSAPGANAGFSYQFERALFWLAQSPSGFLVGIETDDDVAIRGPDSSQVLEQDKHSIQQNGAPFGNRSKDLWNTLAIWLDALESGVVSADMAVFLMVTNKKLPECLAHQIGRAARADEADSCIAALQEAAKDPPAKIESHVQRVLRNESRDHLKKLILKCQIVDGAAAEASDTLRKEAIARLQIPEWCGAYADSISHELLGWIHTYAMDCWRQRQPAWIKRDSFVNQLHAIVARIKRQMSRERAEHLIPVPSEKVGEERGRPFVKQLHLVTEDDALVDGAIQDFIRCNVEKIRLSKQGDITDEDWLTFETTLASRWERIRARVLRTRKSHPECDQGFEVFTEVTEGYREKLAGFDTEQTYLTSGTYHRLADMIRLGWHPNFKELMQQIKDVQ